MLEPRVDIKITSITAASGLQFWMVTALFRVRTLAHKVPFPSNKKYLI